MSEPAPTGRSTGRLAQTVGDMARSLAVVLAVVGVVLLITWRPQPEPVKVVDVEPFAALVASQAPFEALRLPAPNTGFRPTSVRWEATAESAGELVWFIGYVTPSEQYVQISQSTASSVDFLREQTAGGVPAGTVMIDGNEWERFESAERRSLVRSADAVTLVSGTGSWEELEQVTAALVPVAD